MTSLSTSQPWNCPNCSELIEPQFDQCWKCGTPVPNEIVAKYHDPTEDTEETTEMSDDAVAAPAASNLGWSVLAFVLFLPLGLMALLYSILAEISRINEKTVLFQDYSRRAADWRLLAFVVSGMLLIFAFIIAMVAR